MSTNMHQFAERPVNSLVSVIIPTYNCGKYIRESINSALFQTYTKLEVVVVDDGSTDDTEAVLEIYGQRIKYFRKENGGPASARNFGIKNASGEFIAFLDADDMWLPNKLALQIAYLQEHPEIGAVFSIQDDGCKDIDKYSKSTRKRIRSGYIFDELLKGNFVSTSTTVVRRNVFEDVGLFDEDRNLISVEDFNFWIRVSIKHKFGFIDEIFSIKGIRTDSLTEDFENMYSADIYNFRKIKALFRKWGISENRAYHAGLGNYYYEFGDQYFYRGQLKKARRKLLKSLVYRPFRLDAWVRTGLTLLPLKVLGYLRKRKKAQRSTGIPLLQVDLPDKLGETRKEE